MSRGSSTGSRRCFPPRRWRKVDSLPLGIAVGLAAGLAFAYLVAMQPDPAIGRHHYWEVMLPGSLAGAIVGFATQKYGRRPDAARA